jgi:signal transduction histidine kinase/GAF domain-containing protein
MARTPYEIELWFYSPLAEAACAEPSNPTEALEMMADDERELAAWAQRCPPTFANKAALVGAERARLEGRVADAEIGFECAAKLAQQHELIHEEALAHELAARLYAARGLNSVARGKFLLARSCYVRWGALGKVSLLDAQLGSTEDLAPSLDDALELLDLKVVVSALQTVSSSFELDALIQALLTSALLHAAAERGVLVLLDDEPRIRARAASEMTAIRVTPDNAPLSPDSVPESILRYVLRSGERVATRDGVVPMPWGADSYFERQTVRSLLCLPIVARGKAVGALYLENTLTRQSYSARGLAVLQLIAWQAAISLENARLYSGIHDAQQRTARAERASRTGSFAWRPHTQQIEFSDQFSRIYGVEGPPSIALLRERVHPDDRELFDEMTSDSARYEGQTVEHRLVMPDGTIKHVAAIASRLGTDEYAGTIRDVTEAKQTEEALQRTQAALTDMTRLGSLAEMAASIAHEVNQPITGISLNASTCRRQLSDERLDLPGARRALERIQRDAGRATAVVQRMRALFSKSQEKMAALDLNDAILEVVALARGRIRAAGTTLVLDLFAGLPAALGDRVQLQQVVMNLLNNALDAMSTISSARTLIIRTLLADGGQLRCEVEDRGQGVLAADCRRIFEPFYTTKRDGMGIGLSICSNIVASHNGEISVARNADGPGSTFYFLLPASESLPRRSTSA